MSATVLRSATIVGLLVLVSSSLQAQVATGGVEACPASVTDSTTASVVHPKYTSGPKPRYPMALWRDGVVGDVRVQFVVGCDGRVDSTTVAVLSATDSLFAKAAVTAMVASAFSPAMLDGRAVRYRREQVIRFQLSEKP